MSVVAGVDFGTLSVRVSLFDHKLGRLGAGAAEYPLHRKKEDPDHATQSHRDHMDALAAATHKALLDAGVPGSAVEAIALDTTGSSVIPVDEQLQPLDDYYLWCDHRAWEEAALITRIANETGLEAIDWSRRRLLVRVGLRQAAALAAPQSGQTPPFRHGAGALRHGGGRALRHHRPRAGPAQRLRHGPQMDVESRRSAASRPTLSSNGWTRCSPASAPSSAATTRRATASPGG